MKRWRAILVSVLLLPVAAPAWAIAPGPLAGRASLGTATVTGVRDGGDAVLADGRVIRLVGLELPNGRLAMAAHDAEAALLGGGPLALLATDCKSDRYGRLPVEAVTADGRWVQGALLERGMARVATTPDCRRDAGLLLGAEAEARAARRGLWADPAYALRRPEETPRFVDSVQVVQGRVTSANAVRGAVYLNFGEDWRRSLGVRIPPAVLRAMTVDPLVLAGRELRVRGWIGKGVGPMITVNHPEQIELVAAGSPGPDGQRENGQ